MKITYINAPKTVPASALVPGMVVHYVDDDEETPMLVSRKGVNDLMVVQFNGYGAYDVLADDQEYVVLDAELIINK